MSPSTLNHSIPNEEFEDNLNLSIPGLGVEYPPYRHGPEALEVLASRFFKPSPALTKVLSINRFTGIESRASVGCIDHPLFNQASPPSIKQLNDYFCEEGVRLSVNACKKAIEEWGGSVNEITHMVSTTCTNSANPGFDHYVRKQLGIKSSIEKVLLHGIGCSGGLAAIRTAAGLALGSSYRHKPARILVLACEITTLLVRSELESIDQEQNVRIGVCLFSDCASACILSNNIGCGQDASPVYEILGWKHEIVDDTESDLRFDADPLGWKVVLTPQVPVRCSKAVAPAFEHLISTIPSIKNSKQSSTAADFDWALHPGGSTIITGVQKALNVTEEHLRASYETYMSHGNSSSATIMAVLNKLRSIPGGKDNTIACAFGPGISLELIVLKRRRCRTNGCFNEGLDVKANGCTHENGLRENNEIDDLPIEDID